MSEKVTEGFYVLKTEHGYLVKLDNTFESTEFSKSIHNAEKYSEKDYPWAVVMSDAYQQKFNATGEVELVYCEGNHEYNESEVDTVSVSRGYLKSIIQTLESEDAAIKVKETAKELKMLLRQE